VTKTNALLQRGLKKVWASKSGGVLVYIAFGLPILLGAMALSIDLGRAFILNTELKDFSDAAALAGAAELDGRDGARNAAFQAATTGLEGTLVNIQAFATDGSGPNIAVENVVFLRNLPADGTDFDADDIAESDQDARFIFVSVVDRNVRSGLSRALGVIPDFITDARSIAGFTAVTCKVPALFMCNPLEDELFPDTNCDLSILTIGPKAKLKPIAEAGDCLRGKGVLLKTGGGSGGDYFPGEFGLLDCELFKQANPDYKGNSGANCVAESIAQAAPNNCIAGRAFVQTGQATMPVANAINVRFDYYGPFFGGNKTGNPDAPRNNPLYRPAKNVTKGFKPPIDGAKGCSEEAGLDEEGNPEPAMAFPRDTCFGGGNSCASGRWGDGVWHDGTQDVAYWDINHQGQSYPGGGYANYANMTRYEVYREEINTDLTDNPGIPMPTDHPTDPNHSMLEEGKACNYTAGVFSDPGDDGKEDGPDEEDRRVLRVAAINCLEFAPLHGASSNNPDGLPIEGIVKVFLTEPAFIPGGASKQDTTSKDDTNFDIWGEFIGVEDNQFYGLRDIVQLYR
jgi:Flp pilus assembly protein TadG